MEESSMPISRRRFLKTATTAIVAGGVCSQLRLGPLSLAEAHAEAAKAGETVVGTWCAMCGPAANCALYAFAKDGKFTRVAGMKEAPQNKGALCCKAHGSVDWVYSKDRIQYPMRRIGKKGEGKFERITWDEAIKTLADKLKEQKEKYGPESLSMLSPARRDYSEFLYRFLIAHGSPHYGHSGICAMQLSFTFMYTMAQRPSPDYGAADLILVWGKQPVFSGPPLKSTALMKAHERKAKIYTIKPSIEVDSIFADEWVPVRPGTDAALALGMLHVITKENLIDKEFVDKWCYGYDKLVEHVKQYTPEWAEKHCGVEAEQIVRVARAYATTPKAAIDFGNGLEHSRSASDAIRSIAILIAITGHLDRPGCNLFGGGQTEMARIGDVHMRERYTQEWVDKMVGPEFPKAFQPFIEGTSSGYYKMFEDVLSGKPTIRCIVAPGTQPLVSTRNTKRIKEALEKLDYFVVVDTHRTADMPWADLVIPALTPYEHGDVLGVNGPLLMARTPIIEPVTEGKSMQQFLCDLGVAMGYKEEFWNGDMTACQDEMLKRTKMTLADLRSHKSGITYKPIERTYEKFENVFKARSPRMSKEPFLPEGKVAIYNTSFEKAGYSPLPEWHDAPQSVTNTPDLAKKYPLTLSDYHTSISYTAAWQRNVPFLREVEPEPMLHIHPETAKARGIAHGDWVTVESPMGSLKLKAEYYPGIRKDTVMVLHGWWQGCEGFGNEKDMSLFDGGANVNLLYPTDAETCFDPLVTAMCSQALVEVKKA